MLKASSQAPGTWKRRLLAVAGFVATLTVLVVFFANSPVVVFPVGIGVPLAIAITYSVIAKKRTAQFHQSIRKNGIWGSAEVVASKQITTTRSTSVVLELDLRVQIPDEESYRVHFNQSIELTRLHEIGVGKSVSVVVHKEDKTGMLLMLN